MSRPQKADGEKRTSKIEVRLTPAEKSQLKELAQLNGARPSDFIRETVLSAKRLRHVATPDRAALIRLTAELGKVGSNLNQIAHVLNLNALNGEPVQLSTTAIEKVLAGVDFLTTAIQEELRRGH